MDMTESIQPRSDQINADSLISGPQTYTIEKVTEGAAEQPFDFHLTESPGRAYRPSKSMRRVIVSAWGPNTENYVGKRLTIYRNPETRFGKDIVGGLEISHMSHLDKPLQVSLTATRGKRKPFTVQPLVEMVPRDWAAEVEAADTDQLRNLWHEAPAEHQARIQERATQLKENTTHG